MTHSSSTNYGAMAFFKKQLPGYRTLDMGPARYRNTNTEAQKFREQRCPQILQGLTTC